jgi:uncharacterized membrane protein YqaE (UPF0057 family)
MIVVCVTLLPPVCVFLESDYSDLVACVLLISEKYGA